MELEQWKFMQTTMPDIKENLLAGRNIRANELLSGLIAGQRKYAGTDTLPSELKIEAERLYNKWGRPLPAAIIALLSGGFYLYAGISRRRIGRNIRMAMMAVTWLLLIYIGAILGVLWWISGHVPLSNGSEMMMFIGAVWANQSWGRYWGWDPKETCALVMFLIYSVPMHWASRPLKCFRKPRVLHWYLLLAVFSVLFTYFGANYLLPGLHSYA